MKRFCDEQFWQPLMGFVALAATVILCGYLLAYAWSPRQYRDYYVDVDARVGVYHVWQYVRFSSDIKVYSATNPEDALKVYRELSESLGPEKGVKNDEMP